MLLRRVSHHIKTQNWFAVFTDLLIVIVGIYLGLKASNYASYQQVKTQYHSDIKSLISETRTDIDTLDHYITYHDNDLLPAIDSVREIIESCDVDKVMIFEKHISLFFGTFTASAVNQVDVQPLLKLPQYFPHRSRAFQKSLKAYAQLSLNLYEVNKVNAGYVAEQSKVLDDYFRLKLINNKWEIEANLPFKTLCTDFKMLNAVNKIVFMYKIHMQQVIEHKANSQELLSSLKAEIERIE